MKVALDENSKIINIQESVPDKEYYCCVCHEKLIRNFGLERQYFSHQHDKENNNCELKLKIILKDSPIDFGNDDRLILNKYYNEQFQNTDIVMSDYDSEEGYKLTQEQKDIIFAPENRIKISALAGSSKTTTLYYYAKEHPYKKFLYLVYNKAMQMEAQKTFGKLNNVIIKTIHGLAYQFVGKYYRDKLTNNYNAVDVIKDLNLDWKDDQELAVHINDMLKAYMLSNIEDIESIDLFNDKEYKKIRPIIIELCKRLWNMKKDYHSPIEVEHDFYLKLFQLAHYDMSKLYDAILLDESQDSSKLVLDILKNSNIKNIVIVGDKYQSLYRWRSSIDIAKYFSGKEYSLTTSFRVSQNIAHIANLIVEDFLNEDIHMNGFNKNQKIVNKINTNNTYAVLCRTNAYILSEVIDAIDYNTNKKNKKIYLEGGYKSYKFKDILDCYYFSLGHKINNKIFNKFKDYYQMLEYAENNNDVEILSLVRVCERYGSRIPDMINRIKNNIVKDKVRADIIFTTIHKSKGQTYKIPIKVSDDIFDLNEYFKDKYIRHETEKYKDVDIFSEISIIYVAITRCANEIELPNSVKQYLITRYKYFNEKGSAEVA